MKAAIKADGLTRAFEGKNAVNGVSFTVGKGEIYGFLGPNGAGKSTLVKMLVTLLTPTSGDAEVAGFSVAKRPDQVRLRIGTALQEAALDGQQTGAEFLALQGRLYGLGGAGLRKRVEELKGLVDIGEAFGNRISTYSGGMKRRLDLAAALIHDPEVLFLDEPTTGLDPASREQVWQEVRRLNRDRGMTIFLTTQYLEEADRLADRIGIINGGDLAAEGTPKELKEKVGQDFVEIEAVMPDAAMKGLAGLPGVTAADRTPNGVRLSAADGSKVVGRAAVLLSTSEVDVQSITVRSTSLDDVFFAVTGNKLSKGDDD